MIRLVVAALVVGGVGLYAQDGDRLERPSTSDYQKFNDLRYGRSPVAGDADRRLIDKVVRYHVLQIAEPRFTGVDGPMNNAVREFAEKVVLIPRPNETSDDKRRAAADEIGAIAVGHLEKLIRNNPKRIVQLSAARMLAEVGKTGYDGTAKPAVELIRDADVSDAIKFYAIQALGNLLAYVEDPALPDKSAFRRANRALEHETLKALIEFIFQPRELPPGTSPEVMDAVRYVRREAVRALGFARAHTIRYEDKVVCRPGLALLRVAARDGLKPEPSLSERVEALVGFCQLFPIVRTVDRDIHLDYAAKQFGQALIDVVSVQLNNPNEILIPWKHTAARLEDGMQKWERSARDMRLDGADLVTELTARAIPNILDPMKKGVPGVTADPATVVTWLREMRLKNASLHKSADSAIEPIGEGK